MPAQTGFADAEMVTEAAASGLTVMVTTFEVAGLPEGQVAPDVMIHTIPSPFAGTQAYVEFVAPVITKPFFFHCHEGTAPPFTAVAVKVTVVPAHTGFAEGETDTEAASNGLTVMVMAFDIAGLPVGHVAPDVSEQVNTSLFDGVAVYAEFVAPVITVPFFFHW